MKPTPRLKDGWWHAWVTVGAKPNGRPDQRHVKRRTREAAEARIDELLAQRKTGKVEKAGRKPTVQEWLETYFEKIAPRRCDPTTVYDYRSKCRTWVYPSHGRKRVDRFASEDLDDIYLTMARAGKADSTILKLHRILSRALEVAFRRGVVPVNVAKLIDPPTAKKVEIKPLSEAEAVTVVESAELKRNAARWSVALALGLRQGEALGLRWEYVDLDAAKMRVWWQLHRRSFAHGCEGTCGRRRGGNCPQRVLPLRSGDVHVKGGLILKEPKGKSRREIPLPAELLEALKAHREVQDLEKMMAGDAYESWGFVFARLDGSPIDPGEDWDQWKALLKAAGVRDARVHDGRHTAATVLLALGVKIEVVQELLGHSDIRLTRGYAQVASAMAREATDRIGSALLKKRGTP